MTKSTPLQATDKPAKPRPDFPLFPHASGKWAKKIRGKMHYFGTWDDPQGALEEYAKHRDRLHAGLGRDDGRGEPTVADMINQFLESKRQLMLAGELSALTWRDYYETGVRMSKAFKRSRRLSELTPAIFDRYKADLAKTRSPGAVGNEVNRVRVICNWAFEQGPIEKPIRFGPAFKRPSKRVMRLERAKRGSRMFEAAELKQLLEKASVPMKAMILLGVNCGLGNTDIADLQERHLDLKRGWLDYPRPKTGIGRRCKLWPETFEAIRAAMAMRPEPMSAADADCIFLTDRGARYVVTRPREGKSAVRTDSVRWEFNELLAATNLKQAGLCFYGLRHCFETIGGESRDQVAVDICMGHVDPSMGAHYRERVSDDRLADVVKVVHAWLWPKDEQPATIPFNQAAGG